MIHFKSFTIFMKYWIYCTSLPFLSRNAFFWCNGLFLTFGFWRNLTAVDIYNYFIIMWIQMKKWKFKNWIKLYYKTFRWVIWGVGGLVMFLIQNLPVHNVCKTYQRLLISYWSLQGFSFVLLSFSFTNWSLWKVVVINLLELGWGSSVHD